MPRTIRWEAHEHEHADKSADWFWALGIIVLSGAITALLFGNILFAILIVIGGATMGLLGSTPARVRRFALTPRGIMIDDSLYPYQMLAAFWVQHPTADTPAMLIVDANQFLSPHMIIPLDDNDPDLVREYLLDFLPEEELHEPFAQRLAEMFGL